MAITAIEEFDPDSIDTNQLIEELSNLVVDEPKREKKEQNKEAELIEQLSIAREQIAELQQQLLDFNNIFEEYKRQDRKVPINVEYLYNQILFLKHYNEEFAYLIIKNDKIARIEATDQEI